MARKTSKKGSHAFIRSINISGGFLDGTQLNFAPGYGCMIGHRGAGKTTTFELIRHVLRPRDVRPADVINLLKNNLRDGCVTVTVETALGRRFVATRSFQGAMDVRDDAGAAGPVDLEKDGLFPIEVYGIHEIEETAVEPLRRRALIDRFEREASRRIADHSKSLLTELRENASALRSWVEEGLAVADHKGELESIEKQLNALETTGPDAARINAAHAANAVRERERIAVARASTDVAAVGPSADRWLRDLAASLRTALDPAAFTGPNEALVREATAAATGLADRLDRLLIEIRNAADEAALVVETKQRALAAVHQVRNEEYRALVLQSAEASRRAAERDALVRRWGELTTRIADLENRRLQSRRLEERRRELLSALSALRDERTRLRRSVATRLNNELQGHFEVVIDQGGFTDDYVAFLDPALKGSGLQYKSMLKQIAARFDPMRLAQLVRAGDHAMIARELEIEPDRAEKLVKALHKSLFELEVVDVDDAVDLRLSDRGTWKSATESSTGQKCTVVLAILLLVSEHPLLIDQPEGNLDNEFVVDKIVPILQGVKANRQLIFATHNANLVVVAEADRVHVMQSNGKNASCAGEGTVDEQTRAIEKILEGGRDAFKKRGRSYGH